MQHFFFCCRFFLTSWTQRSKTFNYIWKKKAYLASWQHESISEADGVRHDASAVWRRYATSKFRCKRVKGGHVHHLYLQPINYEFIQKVFGSQKSKRMSKYTNKWAIQNHELFHLLLLKWVSIRSMWPWCHLGQNDKSWHAQEKQQLEIMEFEGQTPAPPGLLQALGGRWGVSMVVADDAIPT